ncbi:MAG: potassium-transporting ATPase subunit KdpC [Anaerolineae bacterium]
MLRHVHTAVVALVTFIVLTGVVYPLVMTLIGQVVFPSQANGSLIEDNGEVVGSELIGQRFDESRYFWSRPSAVDYMQGIAPELGVSSGASNLGPANAALDEAVELRRTSFRAANGLSEEVEVPAEMLFASGSGLDPHISPEAARLQVNRVAEARGLAPDTVAALVEDFVEGAQFSLLGEPRVNVLLLNLALDALQ